MTPPSVGPTVNAVRRPSFIAVRVVAATLGAALTAAGFWALLSIPRGPREFMYLNPPGGNAWWPLPFAPANGFTPEQLSSHVARAIFLLPATLLLGYAVRRPWRAVVYGSPRATVLLCAALTTAISACVIRGVPLQDDDATLLMQAQFLTHGLVADPTHPASAAFAEPFTIFTHVGMSGMYLFGGPLVLAVGYPWRVPWIGQVALVALTIWCVFHAAARQEHRGLASLGALLLALSPMLTFTSATPVSQVPALAGVSLAVLGLTVPNCGGGALLGTGLGLAFASRPQTAVPVGLALMLVAGRKDRRWLGGMVMAGLPWLVAVAWYNQVLTGVPWRLPRALYGGEMEAYGFGTVVRAYEHTPAKALALAGVTLVRLNGWALGWPLSLAGPLLWFLVGRPCRRAVAPWCWVALATFVFQAGYALVGISETGAIYHHAVLPFVALSTAAVLLEAAARRWGPWIQTTAAVSLLAGTTSFYVEHGSRLSRLSAAIEGPRRSLDVERPALVFEDVWGARPQAGWVFGVPFRDRLPSAPIVRYPKPQTAAQLNHLLGRWPDRHCYYLRYDWRRSQYRLSACGDLRAHDREAIEARAALPEGHPGRLDCAGMGQGDWRRAFPYLFGPVTPQARARSSGR